MYMQLTGCTVQAAMLEYAKALAKANDATILETMAFFQKGIALIYNTENQAPTEVI
jgi:hypothetical protein